MSGLVNILKGQIFQYTTNRNMRNERVKKDIYNKFQKIKCLNDENIFEKEFSGIFKSQTTCKYVSANFKPTEITKLRKYLTVGYSGDFLYDFRWMIYCIKENSNLINIFVKNRKEIDKLILFGQYDAALKILEETEKICGISFWSCEYKIFLYKKMKLNTEDIQKDVKDLSGFVLECFNVKNIDNISFSDYKYVLEKYIKTIMEGTDIVPYIKYMVIRRNVEITEKNIMEILKYSVRDPIIDQYILILDICQMMVGKCQDNRIKSYYQ